MRIRALAIAVLATAPAGSAQDEVGSPGRALAFLAARPEVEPLDPVLALPGAHFEVRSGDALEYRLLVPEARSATAGVELDFADGLRLAAPRVEPGSAWRTIRAPLDRYAGRTTRAVEIVARGARPGGLAFYLDDLRVLRADGTAIELFRDDLPGSAPLLRDLARAVGIASVAIDDVLAADHAGFSGGIGDPWTAFDLSSLRALHPAAESPADPQPPRGLVLAGPCVPLRFAEAGAPAGVVAAGQRLSLEPLEGGRYYELWLALANRSHQTIATRIAVFGDDRIRTEIALRVPRRRDSGYSPEPGEGFPARSFALLEVDVAVATGLTTIELPSDPDLAVLAVSALWRRDGSSDPRFRGRWLARAAESREDLAPGDRADLARYSANRRTGALFGEEPGEARAERGVFDALLAGDVAGFRAKLRQRLEAHAALAPSRKAGRIELVAALPANPGSALADRVDELAAVLAASPAGAAPILGGDPEAIAALASTRPDAFADLAQRVRDGAWSAFAFPARPGAEARLGAGGLVALLAEGLATTGGLLAATPRFARVDADLGRLRHLPPWFQVHGIDFALLGADVARPVAAVSRWESTRASVRALATPVRIQGPLRFDPAIWRPWSAAVAGGLRTGSIPVLAEVSAPSAREAAALVEELALSDLAPSVRWARAEELTAGWPEPLPLLALPPPASLPAGAAARAALDALAATRRAERALLRLASVESLSLAAGAKVDAAGLRARWSELLGAAAATDEVAAARGNAIADRADQDAEALLERLPVVLPAGAGVPLVVVDPLPWPRTAVVELPDGALRALRDDGADVPGQRSARGGAVYALDSAGLSARALRVRRDPTGAWAAPAQPVSTSGTTLRSDRFELELDGESGRIAHLWLLPARIDLLKAGGGIAWVRGEEREPIDTLESLEVLERGPVRALARRVLVSPRARVTQEFTLQSGAAWIDVRTRVDPLEGSGSVVETLALARVRAGALLQVPFGNALVPADPRAFRALDGWIAATDGQVTTALMGDAGIACAFADESLRVVLAEDLARGPRETAFALTACEGGARGAGLDALVEERAVRPLLRALAADGPPAQAQAALLEIARIEADGRRTPGPAAGLALFALEPQEGGALRVLVGEMRLEAARVELLLERAPFAARCETLDGRPLEDLRVEGRRVELRLEAGRSGLVSLKLRP